MFQTFTIKIRFSGRKTYQKTAQNTNILHQLFDYLLTFDN